jgi:hypothetical protein
VTAAINPKNCQYIPIKKEVTDFKKFKQSVQRQMQGLIEIELGYVVVKTE